MNKSVIHSTLVKVKADSKQIDEKATRIARIEFEEQESGGLTRCFDRVIVKEAVQTSGNEELIRPTLGDNILDLVLSNNPKYIVDSLQLTKELAKPIVSRKTEDRIVASGNIKSSYRFVNKELQVIRDWCWDGLEAGEDSSGTLQVCAELGKAVKETYVRVVTEVAKLMRISNPNREAIGC
ncbi:unnamed protein product [Nippostrongylus brasiliensis]|uniref:Phenylalanine ammonia-lyase n=1 Tax=Nippostrongylus brasiliensis TaxID=27835 RepID=A0A158R394_NIPBR|nr:unnamed protein product [Nippostrongylus brasiliensis]